jgi:hypothetical protein
MKYTVGLFKASGLLTMGYDMVTPLKAKTSGPRPTGRKSSVELAGRARLIAKVAPKISGRSKAWAAKSLCASLLVALAAEPTNLSFDATAVLKFCLAVIVFPPDVSEEGVEANVFGSMLFSSGVVRHRDRPPIRIREKRQANF